MAFANGQLPIDLHVDFDEVGQTAFANTALFDGAATPGTFWATSPLRLGILRGGATSRTSLVEIHSSRRPLAAMMTQATSAA